MPMPAVILLMPNKLYSTVEVEDMALRREERAKHQTELIKEYGLPLLCFTLNIAGPVKNSPLIGFAFKTGIELIKERLGDSIVHLERFSANTGCEAFVVSKLSAEELKKLMLEIEDTSPIGRWFDLDVIDISGNKLSRSEPRRCIICGDMAAVCARSRAHSVNELQKTTNAAFAAELCGFFGRLGYDALIREVHLSPKPGLVDELNSGANSDMDIVSFEKSAAAIEPFFVKMADKSCQYSFPADLMPLLQDIGKKAEDAMYSATDGVNTHRGAIYSLGLLISAGARLIANGYESGVSLIEGITKHAAELAAFQEIPETECSNGARMRMLYGVGGARAQAMNGFPAVKEALQCYESFSKPDTHVDPWCYALLSAMSLTDDTNALKRGGIYGAEYVKKHASDLLCKGMQLTEADLLAFDDELIRLNISCGGAADTLACAMFLYSLKEFFR